MKYLKLFKEAIVEWETDNIKDFYKECKDIVNKSKLSFDDMKEVGDKYDIEVVSYEKFYYELPNDKMREDAPPQNAPVFALVNPVTNKARIVINSFVKNISADLLDFAYHMLKHENVHIGQKRQKGDKESLGEFLGDVTDSKSYFSNKDEVMAFSQSISDEIMKRNPSDLKSSKTLLSRIPLWSHIKRNVDDRTINRYKKYIYLYLEREFGKKNPKD